MPLHKDKNRRRPFSDFGDSKLAVLLKQVQKGRNQQTPPDKESIIKMMSHLDITHDPVEAWDIWVNDCEPLMREVQ
jgi:hypothetical protein